jgi:hypothetical protein
MSKALSYHNTVNGEHWFKSVAYGKAEIETIADPQGGNAKEAPTSIPSPFARFDLVKTAFGSLGGNKKLAGTLNDQQLVSNALDIGEILFNYDDFQDKLKIVAWSRNDLANLQNSSNNGHKQLGDALALYLGQDGKAYNFNKIQRLFIIFYKGEAIGGTSSSTLFFSSANDMSDLNIPFGKQQLLGKVPVPLYERDIEYQKMWYCLKQQPNFQQRFKELDDYLENNFKILRSKSPEIYYQHIQAENGGLLIDSAYNSANAEVLDTGITNDNLEILGLELWKKKDKGGVEIEAKSGFVIKSDTYKSRYPNQPLPLALQDKFNRPLFYSQATWDSSVSVPAYSPLSWRSNDRQLPGQANKYPWLTINDFLEPYLIKVNYPLNTDAFYVGKVEGLQDNRGYLLPLKKDFFDFFSPEDLENGVVKLSMTAGNNGAVSVSLQIPIVGGLVSFEKTYIPGNEENIPMPDLTNNEGFIIEQKFTVNIFPLIKSGDYKLAADYRIQLIEKKGINNDIKLEFYNAGTNARVPSQIDKYRNPRNGNLTDISKYYIQKEEFDYLTVEFNNPNKDLSATLIPKWFKYNGRGKQYSFAIDFGTSNTHIEYQVGNNAPQPFTTKEIQVGTLVAPSFYNAADVLLDLYLPFGYEFLPMKIDKMSAESFPLRTAIVYPEKLDLNQPTFTLTDFNIPFYYEKESPRDEIDINLKWGKNDDGNQKKVTAFFEQLLMMIKTKVLLEGGDIDAVKIYWFYPSSMQKGKINRLRRTWNQLSKDILSANLATEPIAVSESIAPFYHYKDTTPNLTSSEKPVVSIDIGGGTTDIVVYQQNKPTLLSSFRFAANAIYGDAYVGRGVKSNGFVLKYQEKIEAILNSNSLSNLLECNTDAFSKGKSEEIISLWFALEKNKAVINKKDLSFNRMLSDDDDMKIVFVLFYSAVIYHLAKLLKANGIDMPKNITFSGTGSKMLDILTSDDRQLSALTKVMIEKVFEKEYDKRERLQVFSDRNMPKEATCKGALMMDSESLDINPLSIAKVYAATYGDEFESLTYDDLTNSDVKTSVKKEVESFIDFFFEVNKSFDFDDELSVNPTYTRLAKEILKDNLASYLGEGISNKLKDQTDDDKELEETLFFYPLIGAINNLAYQIGSKT